MMHPGIGEMRCRTLATSYCVISQFCGHEQFPIFFIRFEWMSSANNNELNFKFQLYLVDIHHEHEHPP